TMGVLLRKDRTAGATAFGSALPSDTTATTTSHSSLNATDSRFALSSDARYARLRPRIQPTLTGLAGPRGCTFELTNSVSATRSNYFSSDMPVEQLQKPIFGRMNRSILTPLSAGMQAKALPMPHWSCKNGHFASDQTGSRALGSAALGTAGARTPN